MTNFDYLNQEPKFQTFANAAISAEKIIKIDPEASVINCRRAMEFAIKWMYSVDKSLVMPYRDNLNSLIHTDEFKDIVDKTLWKRLDFIRYPNLYKIQTFWQKYCIYSKFIRERFGFYF